MDNAYLTEDKLEHYLSQIFPGTIWERNKIVPDSGIKSRPDFRCDELKLIVEFDGYQHFTSSKVQQGDYLKDAVYEEMGYRVIRIPYFIQLSSRMISYLFGVDCDVPQVYPHGFIDSKVVYPCDYNIPGTKTYIDIIRGLVEAGYHDVADQIHNSFRLAWSEGLINKASVGDDFREYERINPLLCSLIDLVP